MGIAGFCHFIRCELHRARRDIGRHAPNLRRQAHPIARTSRQDRAAVVAALFPGRTRVLGWPFSCGGNHEGTAGCDRHYRDPHRAFVDRPGYRLCDVAALKLHAPADAMDMVWRGACSARPHPCALVAATNLNSLIEHRALHWFATLQSGWKLRRAMLICCGIAML